MSIPFYGGLNGQSFEIKETFNTHADIITDLGYGWNSPIGVGEYILINYGEPGTEEYIANRNVDGTANWNGTIWQKIYDEDASTETSKAKGYVERPSTRNGLGYKLLFYSTGPAPKFKVSSEADLHVADEPYLQVIAEGATDAPDYYEYLLHLSKNQKFNIPDAVVENANVQPSVVDSSDATEDVITLTFHLPQGQVIQTTVPITQLIAGADASASFNETDINRPQLQLSLPVGQTFEDGVTSEVIAAAATPSVQQSYDEEDTLHAHPQLLFSLPQAQIMREAVTLTLLNPSDPPTAAVNYTDATTKNEPYLTLGLPRAVNYYYGDKLAEKTDHANQNLADYNSKIKVEDYYVNTTFGFIHQVSAIDVINSTISFTYVACLQAPLPELKTEQIPTFNADGSPRVVKVDYNQPTTSQTGWTVTIKSPQTPDAAETYEFVAPESGEEKVTVTKGTNAGVANNSTVQFNFKIPRGSKFFVGADVDDDNTSTIVTGAGKGDYYINNSGAGATYAGIIYKWNGTAWVRQPGYGLQGPAGDSINIIAKVRLSVTEVPDIDDVAAVGAYLETQYLLDPASSEVVSVTYYDGVEDKSYWFYKPGAYSDPNRAWDRAILTGGIGSFIEDEYSIDAEKVYNTTYVNSLIVAAPAEIDKDTKTYNAAQIDTLLTAMRDTITALTQQVTDLKAALTQQVTDLKAALAADIADQKRWGDISKLINETTNTDEP